MLGTPRALLRAGARRRAAGGAGEGSSAISHARGGDRDLYAAVVALLAISSSFERLVIMANVSALLLYLLCVAASYQLQRRDVRMAGAPFTFPAAC